MPTHVSARNFLTQKYHATSSIKLSASASAVMDELLTKMFWDAQRVYLAAVQTEANLGGYILTFLFVKEEFYLCQFG